MDEIKVDKNMLQQVIEAVKQLPVKCNDFDAADRWVGIVMMLENMIQSAQEESNTEVTDDGR